MRIAKLHAAPPSSDANANPASPMRKARFRPSTSAAFPPSSRRLAKGSVYAVMTHCRAMSENPSARCMDGSAMFTIVASSAIMSCAMEMNASAPQRRDGFIEMHPGERRPTARSGAPAVP
jgi:hypothetical protein